MLLFSRYIMGQQKFSGDSYLLPHYTPSPLCCDTGEIPKKHSFLRRGVKKIS